MVLTGVTGGAKLDGNTVCIEGIGIVVALEASEVGTNGGFNLVGVNPSPPVVVCVNISVVLTGVICGTKLGVMAVCSG